MIQVGKTNVNRDTTHWVGKTCMHNQN